MNVQEENAKEGVQPKPLLSERPKPTVVNEPEVTSEEIENPSPNEESDNKEEQQENREPENENGNENENDENNDGEDDEDEDDNEEKKKPEPPQVTKVKKLYPAISEFYQTTDRLIFLSYDKDQALEHQEVLGGGEISIY